MSRKLCAIALLVGLTALAGSTAPPAGAVEPAPQDATTAQIGSAARAKHISFVRTGGVHGGKFSYSFSGVGNKHGARALRLASTPAFHALRSRYVPKNTCCDRFLYDIEVRYANGRTKRVVALEGARGIPKVLQNFIDTIESMPTPKPPKIDIDVNFPPGFPFN